MEKRRIFIGADSAGYTLKEILKEKLIKDGYDVTDCGTDSTASCHYPVFAERVCKSVQESPDTLFGILVCGTGIGMSMCANKYKGIRAALCSDTFSARMTRQHNDANVLALGGRVVGKGLALKIVETFLTTPFSNAERHIRRVNMLDQ